MVFDTLLVPALGYGEDLGLKEGLALLLAQFDDALARRPQRRVEGVGLKRLPGDPRRSPIREHSARPTPIN